MDDRHLSEEELSGVSGGVYASDFARIEEEFAWRNKCESCRHRDTYRKYQICVEGYSELLQNYSMEKPILSRCARFDPIPSIRAK